MSTLNYTKIDSYLSLDINNSKGPYKLSIRLNYIPDAFDKTNLINLGINVTGDYTIFSGESDMNQLIILSNMLLVKLISGVRYLRIS